jgi:transcriptional regulator with XRE-family HTH domain
MSLVRKRKSTGEQHESLGNVLRELRGDLRLSQRELGARLGVSRISLSRLEQDMVPSEAFAHLLAAKIAAVDARAGERAARALGVRIVAPPVQAPAPVAKIEPPPVDARVALDAALHAAAEAGDVSARAVRVACVQVLVEAKRLGLSIDQAADLLARATRRHDAVT